MDFNVIFITVFIISAFIGSVSYVVICLQEKHKKRSEQYKGEMKTIGEWKEHYKGMGYGSSNSPYQEVMTMRDYIASQALIGLLSNSDAVNKKAVYDLAEKKGVDVYEIRAMCSYELADIMIKEGNKNES